jgi:threonine dehydratase
MGSASGRAERIVAPPTPLELERARDVVLGALAPTPLIESPLLGGGAMLKVETAQPTGSFKVRGALAALTELPADQQTVTASSGNHALATAWASRRLGHAATIVVPRTTSPAKLDVLHRVHDPVLTFGETFEEAEAHAIELAREGARFLSAYNDPLVIAGQATIGAELEVLAGPLTVVVPVGGGGLLAGLALWGRARGDVKVVGVEVEASRALSASVAAGRIVVVDHRPSLAEAIVGNIERGSVTLPIAIDAVDEMVTVTDAEVAAAMRFLTREHGLVTEGAGAVAAAAMHAGRVAAHGRVVGLLTGRNIDLPVLADVLRAA